MQVIPVAKKYSEPSILEHIWVYDDGIVKGLIHIENNVDAIRFYEAHGFHCTEVKKFEEGTTEYLVRMER